MLHTQYFTVSQLMRLQRATTYEQLAEIALSQLRIMNEHSLTRPGIVCGPISNGGLGSKELNIAHFEMVVNEFVARKHGNFFSQIPFEEALWRVQALLAESDKTVYPKGAGNPLLEGFYRPIFESGLIGSMYFIKGWESSDGARWEHALAILLGISIFYLDEKLAITPRSRL